MTSKYEQDLLNFIHMKGLYPEFLAWMTSRTKKIEMPVPKKRWHWEGEDTL